VLSRRIRDWPERVALTRLTVPRPAFAGTEDQFVVEGKAVRIGPTFTVRTEELQRLGWRIDEAFGHARRDRPQEGGT
jgi:hypothetical protein